jgi:hypothetical protein
VRNDDGRITDWLGQANGGLMANDGNALHAGGTDWSVAGVGDFSGDGRSDILLRNNDGTITDWLGQASGAFVDNTAMASQPLNNVLQIAAVGVQPRHLHTVGVRRQLC